MDASSPRNDPSTDEVFATWLTAARNGSGDDLGRALEACRGYLLAIAQVELGSTLRPKAGASDLVQESLLDAHNGFARFNGHTREELLAWLGRILRFNLADLGRRYRTAERRTINREEAITTDMPAAIVPTPIGPAEQLIAAEEAVRLRAAIARLPNEARDAITWRHQDQLSWDEIGRRLGKSADAARKVWFRAVERLREELHPRHDSTG